MSPARLISDVRASPAWARKIAALPFVRGVAAFQVGSVIMMVTGFASSILVARFLGLQEFGLYASVGAAASMLGVCTAYGQEIVLTTYLGEAVGKKDATAKEMVLRYYLQATAVATVVYTVLIVFAPMFAELVNAGASVGTYLRLVFANSMLQPANVLLFVVLQLGDRPGRVVLIENVSDIAQVALVAWLLFAGWGLYGVLLAPLVITAATVPLYLFLYPSAARRLALPPLRKVAQGVFRGGTRKYLAQGFWVALDQSIGKNLYPNVFFVVLSATAPLQAVGAFRLAFRLCGMVLNLIMPAITRMTSVSIPRLAARDPAGLRAACRKLLAGALALSMMAILAAAVTAPFVVPMVYGQEFAKAVPVLLVLLATNLLATPHVVSVPILRVFRRVWLQSICNAASVGVALLAYLGLHRLLAPEIAMASAMIVFHAGTLLVFLPLRKLLLRPAV